MKEERYHLTLDRYDKNIVINALNTLRTQQIPVSYTHLDAEPEQSEEQPEKRSPAHVR